MYSQENKAPKTLSALETLGQQHIIKHKDSHTQRREG